MSEQNTKIPITSKIYKIIFFPGPATGTCATTCTPGPNHIKWVGHSALSVGDTMQFSIGSVSVELAKFNTDGNNLYITQLAITSFST